MVWIDIKLSSRYFLSKCWLDEISQDQLIQIEHFPDNLTYNNNYTILYVQIEVTGVKPMCNWFLKDIGVQVHSQFAEHSLPIISSVGRGVNGNGGENTIIYSMSSILMFSMKNMF